MTVPTFRDAAGREWLVSIDVAKVKAVRDRTGVHLGRLLDDNLAKYQEVMSDPVTLIDVLYVLCAEQAEKAGVTDEQFGRAMGGDTIEHAATAFEEAFTDFCPSRLRNVLTALRTKAAKIQETGAARALAAIEAIDPEQIFSKRATASPESSGSGPAPSPTAS